MARTQDVRLPASSPCGGADCSSLSRRSARCDSPSLQRFLPPRQHSSSASAPTSIRFSGISAWTDADSNACDWHGVIYSLLQGSVISLCLVQAIRRARKTILGPAPLEEMARNALFFTVGLLGIWRRQQHLGG
ncbi:hypothetical protein PVAP13_2KG207100 [Panicum virgatum]|uniref:Uncharacterized protein n=1 Tax=Panicum virgatum TaxID=38727 RepID=A0A8T0W616_PANVG|nr:hypothetical protein PVAP13_2KG207100 [Panicum virgatum]